MKWKEWYKRHALKLFGASCSFAVAFWFYRWLDFSEKPVDKGQYLVANWLAIPLAGIFITLIAVWLIYVYKNLTLSKDDEEKLEHVAKFLARFKNIWPIKYYLNTLADKREWAGHYWESGYYYEKDEEVESEEAKEKKKFYENLSWMWILPPFFAVSLVAIALNVKNLGFSANEFALSFENVVAEETAEKKWATQGIGNKETLADEIFTSEFVALVQKPNCKIKQVERSGNQVIGTKLNGGAVKTFITESEWSQIKAGLVDCGGSFNIKPGLAESITSAWDKFQDIAWLILALIGLVIIGFVAWQVIKNWKGGLSDFTKDRARRIEKDKVKDRFTDVAGLQEIKDELLEIMHSIEPEPEFEDLEIRLPKGILLHGPPGTGKTLIARAVAGEIDIPFFNISGPDFVEMYVGVGAARMRDTFKKARENAPCVLYVDEIDAVGKQRMSAQSGGDSEYNQTVTQFLIELDGLEAEIEEGKEVILIASTNRFEDLDKALSDRFELKLEMWLPDENEREAIFKVHGKNKFSENVDLKLLAEASEGYAGREISQIVKRAAVLARRRIKRQGLLKRMSKGWKAKIEQQDLIDAHDEVSMGVERKSKKISPEEERDVAYHEAGHALVAKKVATEFRIPKVTVVPRIKVGGFAWALMAKKEFYSEKQLLDRLAVMMGGRAAEKIILGARTMGVGGDLAAATDLVELMVCRWGMSEIGPIDLLKGRQASYGGRTHGHGDAVGNLIFEAKIEWLKKAYEYALKILFDNIDELHKLAHVLVEEKTISSERIDEVLADENYPCKCLIEGWAMPSKEKVLQEVFEEMKEEIQLLGE